MTKRRSKKLSEEEMNEVENFVQTKRPTIPKNYFS